MPRHVRDFVSRRRGRDMNRLYVVESTPTLTGARADHRRPMSPAAIDGVRARAVAGRVGAGAGSGGTDDRLRRGRRGGPRRRTAARASSSPARRSLRPSTPWRTRSTQALGNVGKTVRYVGSGRGDRADQTAALAELDARDGRGQGLDARDRRRQPGLQRSRGPRLREGDAARSACGSASASTTTRPRASATGTSRRRTRSRAGATRAPRTAPSRSCSRSSRRSSSGKTAHELLAAFSDAAREELARHRQGLLDAASCPAPTSKPPGSKALHDGLVDGSAFPSKTRGRAELPAPIRSTSTPDAGLTLLFRPDPTIWDGSYANNGWLQELAKPLTKLTWDNAALIAPATAEKLGVTTEDVVELSLDGRKVEAPSGSCPARPRAASRSTSATAARAAAASPTATGFDAYALRDEPARLWAAPGLEIAQDPPALRRSRRPSTSTRMEGRDPVRAVTAEAYREDPGVVAHMGEPPPGPHDTLYPQLPRGSYAWGMSIDLSTCVGCNACVIACQSENNIPVVGKEQVAARPRHAVDPDRPLLQGQPRRPRRPSTSR